MTRDQGLQATPPGSLPCKHERVTRLARFYVDGRPLYRCLTCDARFVYEDDEPSFKALAALESVDE